MFTDFYLLNLTKLELFFPRKKKSFAVIWKDTRVIATDIDLHLSNRNLG